MTDTFGEAPVVPCWIGGRWQAAPAEEWTPVHDPSTGDVIARTPMLGVPEVDAAVGAAAAAFPAWARTPAPRRAAALFRYRQLLEENFEALAALVTRENGKTLEEARGDVRRGLEVVEFACGIGHLTKGENLPQVAEGIDGQTMREPVGVCVGITPFNFPAMVPLWMFPLAVACGNTFVLKPSEKVPLTANRLAELFAAADLPPGVFNVVHGGRAAVDALCTHPQVAAVSFVGSSDAARHVYAVGCGHGKRVQAAGGAKNVLLVMPDADPDPTLRAVLGSAYGCAGQRCMAGSVLMGVGGAADPLRDRVAAALDGMRVAETSGGGDADMGPVIDGGARERIVGAITAAADTGARLVRDGRGRRHGRGFFVGPTLFDNVTPEMPLFTQEVFGPVLSLLRPSSLEEAVAWMSRLPFGNGATIFTSSGGAARQFIREMPCGMIGVNVGVPAPMPLFSFSGWNQSFFGDLHVQGVEGVLFFTRQKVVLSRWDSAYRRQQGW